MADGGYTWVSGYRVGAHKVGSHWRRKPPVVRLPKFKYVVVEEKRSAPGRKKEKLSGISSRRGLDSPPPD